jgi:hypothetical protein
MLWKSVEKTERGDSERPPLDREVRGSNPSHDTIALLLRRHYEFPQCGIIKEKLLLLLL